MKLFKELPLSFYYGLKATITPPHKVLKPSQEILPVIVSLTSIPSRLPNLHIVVKNILWQSQRPQKMVLWLHESLSDMLPHSLIQLQSEVFEIRFASMDCPHLKLVRSMEEFPDTSIVTCDDDMIYREDWLSTLYREHLEHHKKLLP